MAASEWTCGGLWPSSVTSGGNEMSWQERSGPSVDLRRPAAVLSHLRGGGDELAGALGPVG